ncbi:hypothetical protein [Streptomyces purpureus]|uniref:Uncharacterized protein n=1 Tax=Streptomyces purpureus TaxID=1951 RepID=A0A918GX00_9ACTN|nr:hypothetical protein [Streptomyces purpureus]GGT16179.1 hypothetical protein GCM10014713_06350 [Streptomyces purpureus]
MTGHRPAGAARRGHAPRGRRLASLTLAAARGAGHASGALHAAVASAAERLRHLTGRRGRPAAARDDDEEEKKE